MVRFFHVGEVNGVTPHPTATYGPFKCISACVKTEGGEGGKEGGDTHTHTHTWYTPEHTIDREKGGGFYSHDNSFSAHATHHHFTLVYNNLF